MAHPKVVVQDLTEIFETGLSDRQLQRFIDIAHRKVDSLLDGEGYTDDELKDIELFYAAGLAESRDPRLSSARGTSTQIDYMQESYLEMAFQLDETGRLRQAHESDAPLSWITGTFDG